MIEYNSSALTVRRISASAIISDLSKLHPFYLQQCFTLVLTYSMVQSPSWQANWFAANQDIPHISRNPKVHYRTHKRPPSVSILGQPNPVHIPTSHLLEIHPNIHPSTPRSPQWSPSLRFPHQNPIYPPLLNHTRQMSCPSRCFTPVTILNMYSDVNPLVYMLQGMRPPNFVVFNSSKYFFSARPSKLRARLAIAGIWCLACALAAPMAAALRVTETDYTDSSKFLYRMRNLLSSCSKTHFAEGVIVAVWKLPYRFLSEMCCRYHELKYRLNSCFLFALLAVLWDSPLALRPKIGLSWQTAREHKYLLT